MRFAILAVLMGLFGSAGTEPPHYSEINKAPHLYAERALRDPFTRLKTEVESGRVKLDSSSERTFLKSLLHALSIPEASQLLVFSTSSLQGNLITPGNPRALYFNEDVYVGFIPGGKIEVLSLDPDLGAIFYIFPVPRANERLQAERSARCMNCHSGADSRYVPGVVLESVVPGPNGGSLDAFRRGDTGHQIPYDQRFGGWYVTGLGSVTNHWGNLIGRMRNGEVATQLVEPGKRFDFGKYLKDSSDLVAHLLLEHQAGFVNRVFEATYRTRSLLHVAGGELTTAQKEELDGQARELVRYILFTDEPRLPEGGVQGDAQLKNAFLTNRRVASNGRSLKDFDLRGHIFANRCSYMIYSPMFAALPLEIKTRVSRELSAALEETNDSYPHLPAEEKRAIRTILEETFRGLLHPRES